MFLQCASCRWTGLNDQSTCRYDKRIEVLKCNGYDVASYLTVLSSWRGIVCVPMCWWWSDDSRDDDDDDDAGEMEPQPGGEWFKAFRRQLLGQLQQLRATGKTTHFSRASSAATWYIPAAGGDGGVSLMWSRLWSSLV